MRTVIGALVSLGLLALSGCASKAHFSLQDVASPYAYQYTRERGRIYHAATGRQLSPAELSAYLAGFTVIYVGESHDSIDDHAVQLEILTAMQQRFPGEVALGLEMLGTDSQEEVNQWVAGELGEAEMMRLWARNWGESSYPYYKDILDYVRAHHIPVVALNRPRGTLPPAEEPGAGGEGAAPSSPTRRPHPEIDTDDPYYQAYIGAFLAGHDLDADSRAQFLHSQLLWDETMAETAATFLLEPANTISKLVVFAGANHVRYGFGIPRRLFRRVPVNYTIVSTSVVDFPESARGKLMDIEVPQLPLPPADIVWMVGYESLETQPAPE